MCKTPIADFVRRYAELSPVRLHMPGHKGLKTLGFEPFDITEIDGADDLFAPNGIILKSEQNAGAPTSFSASSSCFVQRFFSSVSVASVASASAASACSPSSCSVADCELVSTRCCSVSTSSSSRFFCNSYFYMGVCDQPHLLVDRAVLQLLAQLTDAVLQLIQLLAERVAVLQRRLRLVQSTQHPLQSLHVNENTRLRLLPGSRRRSAPADPSPAGRACDTPPPDACTRSSCRTRPGAACAETPRSCC